MRFNSQQAIYLQIADVICEKVLVKEWGVEDKIPSVREFAVVIEVNPNTVARAYSYLEDQGVIYTKRGIGFFVATKGITNALQLKKQRFFNEHLPLLFKNMQLLAIDLDQLKTLYSKYKSEQPHEN